MELHFDNPWVGENMIMLCEENIATFGYISKERILNEAMSPSSFDDECVFWSNIDAFHYDPVSMVLYIDDSMSFKKRDFPDE